MAGPYPGPYPQYQSGPPGKPPRPGTVQAAFSLMLAGAAIETVSFLLGLTDLQAARSVVRISMQSQPETRSGADAYSAGFVIGWLIVGLVPVGLWIWMAFANRAGKNWARVVATVFFGLGVLYLGGVLLVQVANGIAFYDSVYATRSLLSVLVLMVGASVMALVWHAQSSAYFTAPKTYGYGYQAYGQPYPPQPMPGPPLPMPGPPPTDGPPAMPPPQ